MAIWHRRYVIGDSFVKDLSFLSKFNVSSPSAPKECILQLSHQHLRVHPSLPHQHLRACPPTSRYIGHMLPLPDERLLTLAPPSLLLPHNHPGLFPCSNRVITSGLEMEHPAWENRAEYMYRINLFARWGNTWLWLQHLEGKGRRIGV